jgi:Arc/MetJ-type ribon-helix-helix transcriptional regulator
VSDTASLAGLHDVFLNIMRVVTICLPGSYVTGLDELIKQNKYPNRSEVIRIAIRDLLVEELWGKNRKPSDNLPLIAQIEKLIPRNAPDVELRPENVQPS